MASLEILRVTLFTLMLAYHDKRVPERYWGESDADRHARIQRIVDVNIRVRDEAPILGFPIEACLSLLTTAEQWESGLERKVHAGEKKGPGGELCLVQVHERATREVADYVDRFYITKDEWKSLPGLDEEATYRCARAGWKIMSKHITRCHIRFDGASRSMASNIYAEYHTPSNNCRALWGKTISERGVTYTIIYRKLVKAQKDSLATRDPS
jgi:hypothetical protein